MSDFNTALAQLVRKQNHEMSNAHFIGVGNINTLFKMRIDLTAENATAAEKIWLKNVAARAEHIRQTIEQYKTEIRQLAEQYANDEDSDPNADTSRSRVFIRKLDEILNRLRLMNAMGELIKKMG